MQHVLGMGSSRSWTHTPNSPFQTSPESCVKTRSQTHLIENKLLEKAEGRGAASLAVGKPGGVVSQLPAGWLKITTSSCTTCSKLSPADLCCCFLLGGCSPPPCCSPCWLLPMAAAPGMLQEQRSRTGSTVGVWVGEEAAAQAGVSACPQLTPTAQVCTGKGCGRAGAAVAGGALQCSCGYRADGCSQPEGQAEPPMLSQSPAPFVCNTRVFSPTTALLLILNSTV